MSLLRTRKPRHAKPSKAAPVLAAGGMTATFGASLAAAAQPAQAATQATAQDFQRLRMCESGGNYSINTGNGYYGAYQFDRRTWQGLGYTGTADQHPAAVQDEAARRLQAARGWQPWPACSRKLGLGATGGDTIVHERASRGGARTTLTVARTASSLSPTAAPAWGHTVFTTDLVKQQRADVRAWQARMKARGWDIAVDGRYGKQSASVAARFAAEKGIKAAPGTVNRAVWTAAWQVRVS